MDECGFRIGNRAYLVGGFLYAESERVLTCQNLSYIGLIVFVHRRAVHTINDNGIKSDFGRTENLKGHWHILGFNEETSLQLARKYQQIFQSYS